MTPRPPIPEDLKRKILVEAGHRCAIPTCKNPDVDIHHIIPWEKCQEHSFENLIALCPNCHRRTHNGEIDRKSLLMYKAQLVSRHEEQTFLVDHPEAPRNTPSWTTRKIKETGKGGIKYSVEIEYPQFQETSSDFVALNAILAGEAFSSLVAEQTDAFNTFAPADEWWASLGNAFASSYSVSLITESLLSIRKSTNSYGAGAAHGNHATYGQNFFLGPLRSINLIDLFHDQKSALSCISEYCISQLEKENHDRTPNDWVRKGAGPKWDNFDSFFLTKSELIIVFQPYHVGCFAEGEREVCLTSRFLTPLLPKNSPLLKLWGASTDA